MREGKSYKHCCVGQIKTWAAAFCLRNFYLKMALFIAGFLALSASYRGCVTIQLRVLVAERQEGGPWTCMHYLHPSDTECPGILCRDGKSIFFPHFSHLLMWKNHLGLVALMWLFPSLRWDGIQIQHPQMLLGRRAEFCHQVSSLCRYGITFWFRVIGYSVPD